MLDTRIKNNEQKGFDPSVQNEERTPPKSQSSTGMFWFLFVLSWLIIIPGICLTVWYVQRGNWLRTQQEKINESASGIEVQLKKRHDTLIKLVDATQTSIKFEKSLLSDITKLRNVNLAAHNIQQTVQTERVGASAFGRLLATVENYPNLKTTDTIRDLMQSADYIEREIAAARRLYNAVALEFNQRIQSWPTIVLANKYQLHSFALFGASVEDKKDVSLKMSVDTTANTSN